MMIFMGSRQALFLAFLIILAVIAKPSFAANGTDENISSFTANDTDENISNFTQNSGEVVASKNVGDSILNSILKNGCQLIKDVRGNYYVQCVKEKVKPRTPSFILNIIGGILNLTDSLAEESGETVRPINLAQINTDTVYGEKKPMKKTDQVEVESANELDKEEGEKDKDEGNEKEEEKMKEKEMKEKKMKEKKMEKNASSLHGSSKGTVSGTGVDNHGDKDNNSADSIIAIVIAVVFCACVLIICLYSLVIQRRNKKFTSAAKTSDSFKEIIVSNSKLDVV